MLNFLIHHIDPVILPLFGPLAVRWYGIAYLCGFLASFLMLHRWSRSGSFSIPSDQVSHFIVLFAFFGVFLGGRLGYQLLYNFDAFITTPLSLFKIWEGGMASHGGFIGSVLFLIWYAKKQGYKFWNISDHLAMTVSLGIGFGRIANFINGELWGRVSNIQWAIIFPQEAGLRYGEYDTSLIEQLVTSGHLFPRHPSQLYQALCEGFLVFGILLLLRKTRWGKKSGVMSGCYLLLYATARIGIEFFREPDSTVYFEWLSKGQLYSILMMVAGALILFKNNLLKK
ncbi:MAG TPA: prolipoprotein diacylglyceryl transferase [Verrucomicrobia bacterium]|nr:prolipoprotein diacylglyceryl transferase [Verrucomicrobiota bacterium]